MATNVLQLGPEKDWSENRELPDDVKWHYNDFPPKEPVTYSAVMITGDPGLTAKQWHKLIWPSTPYCVFYRPGVDQQLGKAAQYYLKCCAAQETAVTPEQFIQDAAAKYYFGQTGIRLSPTNMAFNRQNFPRLSFSDGFHVNIDVNSDDWVDLGDFKQNLFVDPNRRLRVWQESTQDPGVEIRIVITVLEQDDSRVFTFPVTNQDEENAVMTKLVSRPQFVNAGLQVRGHGHAQLGTFHYFWSRLGYGMYIAGGKRIINPHNKEEISYYFSPGDLKPPLNIYFAGARAQEGFEGYPLFRSLHAPNLLFVDPRMEIGQFYTGKYFEEHIKKVIADTVHKLGFTMDDVVTAGSSMGTYPALKLGSELQVHGIVVTKNLADIGYLVERGRLQRPDEFETSYDMARRITDEKLPEGLRKIDREYWQRYEQNDLSRTRIFIGYMLEDDYDNLSVPRLKKTKAIKRVKQAAYKGFHGHHNDKTNDIINWMIYRIRQIMHDDFGRDVY